MNAVMNSSVILFTKDFSRLKYQAEKYVIEAIKAFDNKDYDQFREMILSLDSLERRNLIAEDWSQRLLDSAKYHTPEWYEEAEKKSLSF